MKEAQGQIVLKLCVICVGLPQLGQILTWHISTSCNKCPPFPPFFNTSSPVEVFPPREPLLAMTNRQEVPQSAFVVCQYYTGCTAGFQQVLQDSTLLSHMTFINKTDDKQLVQYVTE